MDSIAAQGSGKIFLIGFMGSGKSHWGKIWSAGNNMPFIDMDTVIEEAEGKTVTDIFETKGESYFRELEATVLRSFEQTENTIIACGGGTPCFHNNMDWMNANGITVCLTASAIQIQERILQEQGKRPLFKNVNPAEILFFIEQKLKEREPFYSQAKIVLNTEEITGNSFDKILQQKT